MEKDFPRDAVFAIPSCLRIFIDVPIRPGVTAAGVIGGIREKCANARYRRWHNIEQLIGCGINLIVESLNFIVGPGLIQIRAFFAKLRPCALVCRDGRKDRIFACLRRWERSVSSASYQSSRITVVVCFSGRFRGAKPTCR